MRSWIILNLSRCAKRPRNPLLIPTMSQRFAPLISVLEEPDVRIRFWAVFAIGGLGQWQTGKPNPRASVEPRVIAALEKMLADEEVAPGNWWSVGREALAMLGPLTPSRGAQLDAETQRVLSEPNSSSGNPSYSQFKTQGLERTNDNRTVECLCESFVRVFP